MGDNGSGKLITRWRHFEEDAKVSLVIDDMNRCWRKDILHEALLPIDVARVLQIPISRMPSVDARVWETSSDGIFRVKEVYQASLEAKV